MGHIVPHILQASHTIWSNNRSGNIPRLFLLKADGTGLEFLRDINLIDYLKEASDSEHMRIVEEPVINDPRSAAVTLFSTTAEGGKESKDMLSLRQRIVRFRQVFSCAGHVSYSHKP